MAAGLHQSFRQHRGAPRHRAELARYDRRNVEAGKILGQQAGRDRLDLGPGAGEIGGVLGRADVVAQEQRAFSAQITSPLRLFTTEIRSELEEGCSTRV